MPAGKKKEKRDMLTKLNKYGIGLTACRREEKRKVMPCQSWVGVLSAGANKNKNVSKLK